MRQAVLLGIPGTKRTVWLEKGAAEAGVEIELLDWRECLGDRESGREGSGDSLGTQKSRIESFGESLEGRKNRVESSGENQENREACSGRWQRVFRENRLQESEIFLKIDPPVWDSCRLEELDGLTQGYRDDLTELAGLEKEQKITFFNHPCGLKILLDKRECKARLQQSGIAVTETLEEKVGSFRELLEAMEARHMSQVFLKPVRGSGAAGVAAFRYQKKTGQMVLYTCGMEDPLTGRLVNTKRLRRFTDRAQILPLLDKLLRLDCMAERWYAKAEHQGYSYDLRAVVQDGQVDFILARLSKGPVTNLHLNNHPLRVSELGLPLSVREQVEELCRTAAGCFGGIRSAGIDILLEKGSLRPRIIEMNGQGDLIYQDIYNENKIYRHQAKMMKEWLYGNDGRHRDS